MKRHPTLAEVYEQFSLILDVPFVIAGGAVRDHLLGVTPKDYDLFVFEKYNRRKLANLEQGPLAAGYGAWHVANVVYKGWPVQVVGPKAYRNVTQLLADFDWNVCMFAYDGKQVFEGMDVADIAPHQWLRLNSDRTPHSTLRRGFRFAERFRMEIFPADLARLCGKIAKQGQHSGVLPRVAVAA